MIKMDAHPPIIFRTCLDLRTEYQAVLGQLPCSTSTRILSSFPNAFQPPKLPRVDPSRHFTYVFTNGGAKLEERIMDGSRLEVKEKRFPISAKKFNLDLKTVYLLDTDQTNATFGKGRLLQLDLDFGKHQNENELELESVSNLGYLTAMKGDPHAHTASLPSAEYVHESMMSHWDDDIVLITLPDKTELNLNGVMNFMGLHEVDLSPEKMGVRAVRALWNNFKLFKELFCPYGKRFLKKMFLKVENVVDGVWYAELINRVTGDIEKTGNESIDLRLTIKGANDNEWLVLARWFKLHIMQRSCVNWMVQLPRTYNELRKDYGIGLNNVCSFGIYLENVFSPLFKNLLSECTEPDEIALRELMEMITGFDSVDEELDEGPEADIESDPKAWDSDANPHYNKYSYHFFENLGQINYLARIKSRRVYAYRPHGGETDCPFHMAACFLVATNISHGTYISKHPGIHYAFFAAQIGISMALTSNLYLSCALEDNPFPTYLKQGMNVCLSTDDRLIFSRFLEALKEEYVLAQKTWKLSEWDMCESARYSILISGHSIETKIAYLGTPGLKLASDIEFVNDPLKTNVPDVRMNYRLEKLVSHLLALNV